MEQKGIKVEHLLGMLPESMFEQLAAETQVDHQVKKLTGKTMFILMLMALLDSERLSLRVMEQLVESYRFRHLSGVESDFQIKHTALSERMKNIKAAYFESIFVQMVELFKRRFKKEGPRIERFDSTLVSVSAKLLKFGMSNGARNKDNLHTFKQVKFTIGFDGVLPLKAKLYTSQKDLGEDGSLSETILESAHDKDSLVVFDRGLKSRQKFKEIDEQGRLFVTRINPTHNYQLLKQLQVPEAEADAELKIESDQLVYLYNKTRTKVKKQLRLIKAIRKDGKEFLFLTNSEDMAALEIASVYRRRWDIEVFFRFLKQELNLRHLVSRTENGIKVMLHMSLLAAMLILVYKDLNKLKGYKLVKARFIEELNTLILKQIIIACDGNPDKLHQTKGFSCFGQ